MKTSSLVMILLAFAWGGCQSDENDLIQPFERIATKVNVKLQVGDVLYENVSADLLVQGFLEDNSVAWEEEFAYDGAETETVISIPFGYHHYVITASLWGASDSQTLTSLELYSDRSDGPVPVTRVFAPSMEAPKLKAVTRSMEYDTEDGLAMIPYSRETFTWDAGKVTGIVDYEYNGESDEFAPARAFEVTYSGNRVSMIEGHQNGEQEVYIRTTYTWLPNGNLSSITENNMGAGHQTIVELAYGENEVVATYEQSNGQAFTYRLTHRWKNATGDQTKKGGAICNEGEYTFDQFINPFRHLGYQDILLNHFSINNKVTEDVEFLACSFPQMAPVSHSYTYNDKGYPLTKTTLYSNGRKGIDVYEY